METRTIECNHLITQEQLTTNESHSNEIKLRLSFYMEITNRTIQVTIWLIDLEDFLLVKWEDMVKFKKMWKKAVVDHNRMYVSNLHLVK